MKGVLKFTVNFWLLSQIFLLILNIKFKIWQLIINGQCVEADFKMYNKEQLIKQNKAISKVLFFFFAFTAAFPNDYFSHFYGSQMFCFGGIKAFLWKIYKIRIYMHILHIIIYIIITYLLEKEPLGH